MYVFTATSNVKASIFNREYAKGMIDSKNLTITVEYNAEKPIDLNTLKKALNRATQFIDNRIIIQNDDPYLIHLLEPKTGSTVHNMLNNIRSMEDSYRLLGDTLPPDTINAYKLTIFNLNTYTATMEGIAKFIRHRMEVDFDLASLVTVSDGTFSVRF